jgi:hypothetical protein
MVLTPRDLAKQTASNSLHNCLRKGHTMENSNDNKMLIYTINMYGEVISARVPVTPEDTERSLVAKASKRINEKGGK